MNFDKNKLHDLISLAKIAPANFDNWINENPKLFPTLIHFYNFEKIDTRVLNNLILEFNDSKLELENKMLITELLENYLFLLNKINLIFNNRLMNLSATFLNAKLVEMYIRDFTKLQARLERTLGIETEKTKDYHLTINFE